MSVLPSFATRRLILREVRESDIPAYEKHFIDYRIIRNLSCIVPWPYPAGGVREFLLTQVFPQQGKDRWVWAIAEKQSPDDLIGIVDLWRNGKPENRGFWLGHEHWGKGYMTEAVCPIMDYAFSTLGFEKLVFANAVGNTRSGRVKEKTGARLVRREPAQFVDPALAEREIYELCKEDWVKFKQSSGA